MDRTETNLLSMSEARIMDDDWTGLSNAAERKKRQNRLHQRAWRRRRDEQRKQANTNDGDSHLSAQNYVTHGLKATNRPPTLDVGTSLWHQVQDSLMPQERMFLAHQIHQQPFEFWEHLREERKAFNAIVLSDRLTSLSLDTRLPNQNTPSTEQHRKPLIPPMIPYITNIMISYGILPPFNFPLSPDHQLIVLIQYNVLRATLTNMSLLRILDRLPEECGQAFNMKDVLPPPDNVPPAFNPTPVQKAVWHDLWIDVIPWASMRDNLILNTSNYDEDDLCNDMVGGLYEGIDDSEARGLLIWGEPWSESAWEVSEGFAKKWTFLLKGCDELLAATNRFREARGEDRLAVEI